MPFAIKALVTLKLAGSNTSCANAWLAIAASGSSEWAFMLVSSNNVCSEDFGGTHNRKLNDRKAAASYDVKAVDIFLLAW
jgi:hypothetical protein